MDNRGKVFWDVIILVLLIWLAIVFLNKFGGELIKADILNFYSNLLVVSITVALGIITYEQNKHIQEDASKENEYLRKQNEEANNINKQLLKIIERNTELEEQKNMPCLNIKHTSGDTIHSVNEEEIEIIFENVSNTIIKYIDIDEIPEEIINDGLSYVINKSANEIVNTFKELFANLLKGHVDKVDFFELFNHNIDMVGINEKISLVVKPRKIKNEKDKYFYVIALNMKIENIYGNKYIEKVFLLLQKNKGGSNVKYFIKGKHIDISKKL